MTEPTRLRHTICGALALTILLVVCGVPRPTLAEDQKTITPCDLLETIDLDSPCLTELHHVLAQATLESDVEGGSQVRSLPNLTVRYGLTNNLELLLVPPTDLLGNNISGFSGTGFGIKAGTGSGRLFEAVAVTSTFGNGSSGLPDVPNVTGTVSAAHALTDGVNISPAMTLSSSPYSDEGLRIPTTRRTFSTDFEADFADRWETQLELGQTLTHSGEAQNYDTVELDQRYMIRANVGITVGLERSFGAGYRETDVTVSGAMLF